MNPDPTCPTCGGDGWDGAGCPVCAGQRKPLQYARLTLADGQRFILRITAETARTIAGIEVDRDGDEVVPKGHHNRLRIVERTAIAKFTPMRMNNHYATLEVAESDR